MPAKQPLKSAAVTRPGDLLREGLSARRPHGYSAAAPNLRAAVTLLLAEPTVGSDGRGCNVLADAGMAAGDLLEDAEQHVLTSKWVGAERDRGNAGRLPAALSCLARADLLAGRTASAGANLAEARGIVAICATPATVQAVTLGELTVLAWRGRGQEARSAAARLDQRT